MTAVTPEQITAILLVDGWHEVRDCDFTQFAVAPASSPANPQKLYQALRYKNATGEIEITPLSQVADFRLKDLAQSVRTY